MEHEWEEIGAFLPKRSRSFKMTSWGSIYHLQYYMISAMFIVFGAFFVGLGVYGLVGPLFSLTKSQDAIPYIFSLLFGLGPLLAGVIIGSFAPREIVVFESKIQYRFFFKFIDYQNNQLIYIRKVIFYNLPIFTIGNVFYIIAKYERTGWFPWVIMPCYMENIEELESYFQDNFNSFKIVDISGTFIPGA